MGPPARAWSRPSSHFHRWQPHPGRAGPLTTFVGAAVDRVEIVPDEVNGE